MNIHGEEEREYILNADATMQYLYEKISYLKGLSEGLDIEDSSKEGKLLKSMILVMEDIVDSVCENEENISELSDYVEVLDEDLSEMEDVIYEDDDEDYEDYEDEDFEYIEMTCPNCGEEISVDSELAEDGEIFCPNCEEKIEL